MEFIDKDLSGRKIEQRRKDSTSVEIEGDSRFCGHRFMLRQKLYGDKRCIYCGNWFHWKQDDSTMWLRNDNVDPHNVDNVLEPLHCGKAHCDDYHKKYLAHQQVKQMEFIASEQNKMMAAWKWGKKLGLVY